jgi:catechol 2,3-dioxygenase-like lactoylglutathione lyase family enzyme
MATPPRAIGHIGITVPDLAAAVDWYQEVLGFRLIGPPTEIDVRNGGPLAQLTKDIFGPSCTKWRFAQLSTANGTVLEICEFIEPGTETPDDNFRYWQQGIFHFCVVDPDVSGLAGRIEQAGGKTRTKCLELFEGQSYQFAFCEDPFGTIIEITSHSLEQMLANQG